MMMACYKLQILKDVLVTQLVDEGSPRRKYDVGHPPDVKMRLVTKISEMKQSIPNG